MINRRVIKLTAIITMLIDHITMAVNRLGNVYDDSMFLFRGIGRIAFPLFAYQYVDSVRKTSNHKNMFIRMLILSVVSEIPFNLLSTNQLYNPGLNVLWLFTTYSALILIKEWVTDVFELKDGVSNYVLDIILFVLFILISHYLDFDYGSFGALLVISIDVSYGDQLKQSILMWLLLTFYYISEPLFLLFSTVAVLLILVYNKDTSMRFSRLESLLYRLFYPLHLFIIWLIFKLL